MENLHVLVYLESGERCAALGDKLEGFRVERVSRAAEVRGSVGPGAQSVLLTSLEDVSEEDLKALRASHPSLAVVLLGNGSQEVSRDLVDSTLGHEEANAGLLAHAVATARERRDLMGALRETESLYRTLFDGVADPVFIFDKETYRFLDCNETVLRNYGYTRRELREMTPKDLHPPEELEVVQANIDQKNPDQANVYTHCTRDGQEVKVEILTDEIDYHGRPAWISICHDVTERIRKEEELRQAREQAEAASQSKSEFLANVSHEIRTPMNAIVGMTDLALGSELTSEQKEYLEIVRLSADSLLSLLNDILDFSKIEAGKLAMDPIEFGLRDALGDVLRTLALRAEEKGLELVCHIEPDVPDRVVADPGRLRQIIVNLVGNAIKFTVEGQIVLRVKLKGRQDDKVRLHFAVHDTGIGIPPEKQESIFEAFAQADGSTTRDFGGTGLGLAISAQLVGMMEGRIWVESEVGEGSTFHFTVEFGLGKQQPEEKAPPRDLQGLRVLLVDDLPINRRIGEEMLSGWGMKTETAQGGEEALERMRAANQQGSAFDLVILDAALPGNKDGFEVAEEVRADQSLKSTTILMLTSSAKRGDAARCRELGVEAYLTKPIIQSDLLDAIRAALSRSEQPASPSPPLITRHSLRESRSRLKILLAEDNLVNQKLALRLLEKRGHDVTLVQNGKEAIDSWKEGDFDVILMDVQMPIMDGLEATRQIRSQEGEGEHIPIIAMTAFAMSGDRQRCLRSGMDEYISKPIQPTLLFEAIEALSESGDG